MSISLAVALYIVIWWIVLFAVLPFGVRTQGEDGNVVPGTPESAPSAPGLVRVFALNTLIASVVFIGAWLAIVYWVLPAVDALVPGE